MDFNHIALLLVLASAFALVAKLTRQPLLIGYLFAGIFLGVTGLISNVHELEGLSRSGVALLLFLLGLEMNLKDLPTVGKAALYTGIGQIVITTGAGFLFAQFLGFATIPSLYIGVALTFSSTIIIVKLLSEKKDLQSLYGRIAIGLLIVQDIAAILLLIFLSGLQNGDTSTTLYLFTIGKSLALLSVIWYLSRNVFPYIFEKYFSNSNEYLFIVSLAWALGLAAFVGGPLGLSMEIGGFLAGIALSGLPEHLQIASKVRPLRDFFLTIFFVLLGTTLVLDQNFVSILVPGILLSLFVLIGNPLIMLVIMGLLGYRKRTSFMAGLTVAQISEFSFVLMAMGISLGHVSQLESSLVIFVGVVTMTLSTYLILESTTIYRNLEKILTIFEKKNVREVAISKSEYFKDHIVLIGCDRTGRALLPTLLKTGKDVLVVDFNPSVVEKLTMKNIPAIFGDISDPEIIELANMHEAATVISTTGSFSDNVALLDHIKKSKNKPLSIYTATDRYEASYFYKNGASYVLVPEIIAGSYIKNLIKTYGLDKKRFQKVGRTHFRRLTSQHS